MRMALLVAAAVITAQPALGEQIERRAGADARGEVVIGNVSGEVTVLGWERAEVQVNADLGAGVERLDFRGEGGRTTIQVVLAKGRHGGGSTDLVVRVPRPSSLSINTVSADQTVSEVRGAQRLQAVSGSITTQVWDEEFEIKTVSGDIEVRGHGGSKPARVTTVSGDVHLEGIGRELELNTVSGDMEVSAPELARVRIKTTNGDLQLQTALARDARIEAEAINGDLQLRLRGAVDAEFDIETFNGELDNCFGPRPQRLREFGPGTQLRFKEGAGTGRVRIKTLNGGVEVCDR